MRYSYSQCLLLIVHKEKIPDQKSFNIPQKNGRRLRQLCVDKTPREQMRVYVLVPYSLRHDQDIHNMFSRSEITVLRTPRFDTALTEAIKADRLEIVEILLKVPMSTETSKEIIVFAEEFNEGILNVILLGQRIETQSESDSLSTQITSDAGCVLNKENLNIIKELTIFCTNIRYRHKYGGFILHFAVLLKNEPLVRIIIQNGAQLEKKTRDGRTPLHLAVENAHRQLRAKRDSMPAISSHLIKHGANIHAVVTGCKDYEGVMPIHLALESCNIHLISLLLNNGASVESDSVRGNVLKLAIKCNSTTVLACVLLHRPSLKRAKNQEAFRYAMKARRSDIIDLLEVYGFGIGPDDAKDVVLLAQATYIGNVGLINDLLKWGGGIYGQSLVELGTSNDNKENDDDDDHHHHHDLYDGIVNRYTRAIFKGPGNFIWKLHMIALKTGNMEAARFLLLLDDSPSRVSLAYDVRDGNYGPWCKFILDSGDLSVFPIVNIMDDKASEKSSECITNHITLVKAAELNINESLFQGLERIKKGIPDWLSEALHSTPPINITQQANALKKQKMVGLKFSYHDLLNMPLPEIVGLFKDNSLAREMETEGYTRRFPDYAPLIEWRLRRAHYRRTLLDKGIKMFAFLFKESERLPFELHELILNYLSNVDLLVLVNVCKLPDLEECGSLPSMKLFLSWY